MSRVDTKSSYDWTQDGVLGLKKQAFIGAMVRGARALAPGMGKAMLGRIGGGALGGAAIGAGAGAISAQPDEGWSNAAKGALLGAGIGAGIRGAPIARGLHAFGKTIPASTIGQLASGGAGQAAARGAGQAAARGAGQVIDTTAVSLPGRAPVKGLLGPGPGGVSPGVSSQPISHGPRGGSMRYHTDVGGSINTVPSSGQVTPLPGQQAGWFARLKNKLGIGGSPAAAAQSQQSVADLVSGGTPATAVKWGHVTALQDLGLHSLNG